MTTRGRLTAYARTLDGLSANPNDTDRRAAYLDVIAPVETPSRAAEMARCSGCALVARGILRRFIEHPILAAQYRDTHAMSDLVEIARGAGAVHGPDRTPEPGDLVIVGGGADGGGPEHVYMVLDVQPDPYDDGGWLVTGLDGGQRDAGGCQLVIQRDHIIGHGRDRGTRANDPGGGSTRLVRFVLDTGAILDRFGR